MTFFAVIDTNVVVSSALKANSIPGHIIEKENGPLYFEEA